VLLSFQMEEVYMILNREDLKSYGCLFHGFT